MTYVVAGLCVLGGIGLGVLGTGIWFAHSWYKNNPFG